MDEDGEIIFEIEIKQEDEEEEYIVLHENRVSRSA